MSHKAPSSPVTKSLPFGFFSGIMRFCPDIEKYNQYDQTGKVMWAFKSAGVSSYPITVFIERLGKERRGKERKGK